MIEGFNGVLSVVKGKLRVAIVICLRRRVIVHHVKKQLVCQASFFGLLTTFSESTTQKRVNVPPLWITDVHVYHKGYNIDLLRNILSYDTIRHFSNTQLFVAHPLSLLNVYIKACQLSSPCCQSSPTVVFPWGSYLSISTYIMPAGDLGAVSIRKTVFPGMAIPMLKIRRPNGRLIFNMRIPIPGKDGLYIETGPWTCVNHVLHRRHCGTHWSINVTVLHYLHWCGL